MPTKSKKAQPPILTNITGIAKPGDLIAIMGSSGSGKTTFLNMLAKRNLQNLEISGKVLVDGYNYENDITNISAYVQQDDVFYREFTVKEHLLFQANLRNIENANERVDIVIDEMGLSDCKNTKIGDPRRGKTISGGERKRLSFATHILKKPPILFCDEPTSGLDSFLANQVVQSLKKIAKSGTIVLTTIHQPPSSTFALFDKLILLAKGQCAYMGSSEKAIHYFRHELIKPCPKNYNPADHYINILSVDPAYPDLSKIRLAKVCQVFQDSKQFSKVKAKIAEAKYVLEVQRAKKIADNKGRRNTVISLWTKNIENGDDPRPDYIPEFKRANICKQLIWLFWRSTIINYRDPMVCIVKILNTTAMAIIFGLIYLNKNPGHYLGAIEKCDQSGSSIPDAPPLTTTSDILNINGSLFILLSLSSFPMVFFVTTVFPVMLPAWREEYYGGLYSMTVAFIAENLMELPMLLLLQLALCAITYFMFGLVPCIQNFLVFYVIMELVAQSAVSFGYMLSTFSENVGLIQAVTPALLCPLMILGGFFVQTSSLPIYLKPVQYLSWFYFGNIALMHNQWDGQKLECLYCNGTRLSYEFCDERLQTDGDNVIYANGFEKIGLWDGAIYLLALIFGYRFVAWLVLLFKFRAGNR